MPTLGGMQFWADELFFHKWRIQRNVMTGHCRLVDENSLRHAFGTFDQCQAVLEQIKRDRKLPPMQGKGVILLHGLAGPRIEMLPLAKYLEREGKFTVFNVGYPSTRRGIDEHAKTLAGIVAHLDGIEEIDFVGFSMGNIVIRRYLADQSDAAKGKRLDPRIKRFVMLGPPNQGAELATQLRGNPAAKLLLGESLAQLGERWPGRSSVWACRRASSGSSPADGQRPGVQSRASPATTTGLSPWPAPGWPGRADFVLVPVFHSLIPMSAKVAEYTLRFLQHGYFGGVKGKG